MHFRGVIRLLGGATAAILFGVLGGGCASGPFERPELRPTEDLSRLHARYFGASTILLADAQGGILIDGFFSRPSLTGMVTGFRSHPDRIDDAMKTALAGRVDAVFVAHTHHDHALDATTVAIRKGADLYGPPNLSSIAGRNGKEVKRLQDQCVIQVGRFKITPIETHHAQGPWPIRFLERLVFFPGVRQFQFDTNFGFYIEHPDANVLIMPSAALPQNGFGAIKPDVAFLSIAYLARQSEAARQRYWTECVGTRTTKLVLPIHWDNLMGDWNGPFRPIPRPFDFVQRASNEFADRARRSDRVIDVRYLPPSRAVPLWPYGAAADQ